MDFLFLKRTMVLSDIEIANLVQMKPVTNNVINNIIMMKSCELLKTCLVSAEITRQKSVPAN